MEGKTMEGKTMEGEAREGIIPPNFSRFATHPTIRDGDSSRARRLPNFDQLHEEGARQTLFCKSQEHSAWKRSKGHHSASPRGEQYRREVSFVNTPQPSASETGAGAHKSKAWGGGIGKLFRRKRHGSLAPNEKDRSSAMLETSTPHKTSSFRRRSVDYDSWSNADSHSEPRTVSASGASVSSGSKHRRLRDLLRRKTQDGEGKDADERSTPRLSSAFSLFKAPPEPRKSILREALDANEEQSSDSNDENPMYLQAGANITSHNQPVSKPQTFGDGASLLSGSHPLPTSEEKKKRKAWYQRVFSRKHKSKSKGQPEPTRSVSFISPTAAGSRHGAFSDVGDSRRPSIAQSDILGERLTFQVPPSNGPQSRLIIDTDDPSSRLTTSGADGLRAPVTNSKSGAEKKSSSAFKLFSFGKKTKSEKGAKTTSAEGGKGGDRERGTEDGRVIITENQIDEEEKVRLERVRTETREEFLEALRDLQKRFFVKQGKHALWKHQNLRELLARRPPREKLERPLDSPPAAPGDVRAVYTNTAEEVALRQEREDFVLEELLSKADLEARRALELNAQVALKSSQELNRVANQCITPSGKIVDVKRVDWRVIDARQQIEAMKMAFLMSKMASLVNQVFDSEGDLRDLSRLLTNTEDQIENWVSQGFLTQPEQTALTVDGFQKIGQQVQGKYIVEHLNMLVKTAAGAAHSTYYNDMVELAKDVDKLRDHICAVIDESFDYLAHRLLAVRKSELLQGDVDSHHRIENLGPDCFVIPVFIQSHLKILADVDRQRHLQFANTVELDKKGQVKPPEDIQERQEMLMRRLVAYKKLPVGEGFALLSDKMAMESAEKRLNGKWGSYKMFERWLQDALKWQWQDVSIQVNLRNGAISLEQAVAQKKSAIKAQVDRKLTQLWKSRSIEAGAEGVELLHQYLVEAIGSRPPIYQSCSQSEWENTAMVAEDERARLVRIVVSPLGREIMKQGTYFDQKKNGFQIKKAAGVVPIIELLTRIKQLLDKDATIINDVEVQTILEEVQVEAERVWKKVDVVQKSRENMEMAAEKKLQILEKKRSEAEAALKREHEKLDSVKANEDVIEEKEFELLQNQKELEETKRRVTDLIELSRTNKVKLKDLEREIKTSKKKVSEEQKKLKAVEASALSKHIAVETKEEKLHNLLTLPSRPQHQPPTSSKTITDGDAATANESVLGADGEKKKKTWLAKMLGTTSTKHKSSHGPSNKSEIVNLPLASRRPPGGGFQSDDKADAFRSNEDRNLTPRDDPPYAKSRSLSDYPHIQTPLSHSPGFAGFPGSTEEFLAQPDPTPPELSKGPSDIHPDNIASSQPSPVPPQSSSSVSDVVERFQLPGASAFPATRHSMGNLLERNPLPDSVLQYALPNSGTRSPTTIIPVVPAFSNPYGRASSSSEAVRRAHESPPSPPPPVLRSTLPPLESRNSLPSDPSCSPIKVADSPATTAHGVSVNKSLVSSRERRMSDSACLYESSGKKEKSTTAHKPAKLWKKFIGANTATAPAVVKVESGARVATSMESDPHVPPDPTAEGGGGFSPSQANSESSKSNIRKKKKGWTNWFATAKRTTSSKSHEDPEKNSKKSRKGQRGLKGRSPRGTDSNVYWKRDTVSLAGGRTAEEDGGGGGYMSDSGYSAWTATELGEHVPLVVEHNPLESVVVRTLPPIPLSPVPILPAPLLSNLPNQASNPPAVAVPPTAHTSYFSGGEFGRAIPLIIPNDSQRLSSTPGDSKPQGPSPTLGDTRQQRPSPTLGDTRQQRPSPTPDATEQPVSKFSQESQTELSPAPRTNSEQIVLSVSGPGSDHAVRQLARATVPSVVQSRGVERDHVVPKSLRRSSQSFTPPSPTGRLIEHEDYEISPSLIATGDSPGKAPHTDSLWRRKLWASDEDMGAQSHVITRRLEGEPAALHTSPPDGAEHETSYSDELGFKLESIDLDEKNIPPSLKPSPGSTANVITTPPVKFIGVKEQRDEPSPCPSTLLLAGSGSFVKTPSVRDLFESQFERDTIPLLDDLLRRMTLTMLLNKDERRGLERQFKIVHFNPGECLYREGERIDRLYLIQSGEAVSLRSAAVLKRADAIFEGAVLDLVKEILAPSRICEFNEDFGVSSLDLEGSSDRLSPSREKTPVSQQDGGSPVGAVKEKFEKKLAAIRARIEEVFAGDTDRRFYCPSDIRASLSEPCTTWQIDLAALTERVDYAAWRTRYELRKAIERIGVLHNLSRDEMSELVRHLPARLLNETEVVERAKINDTIWIVWQGCVIVVESQSARLEQYYHSDSFGVETFGVESRPELRCSPKTFPTIYFTITLQDIETVTKETFECFLQRKPEEGREDIPTILASLESVSAIGDSFKKKRKKGLTGMISTSAKFLGMKVHHHGKDPAAETLAQSTNSPEKKKLGKSKSIKLKKQGSKDSNSPFASRPVTKKKIVSLQD